MIPVPFACEPGDKLRVILHEPYGTKLIVGDLVTVIAAGVWIESGRPMPVVKVSTSHGPQTLGFDAVEPFTLPVYTPGDPDELVNEFFLSIVHADPELEALVVQADADLAAVAAAEEQLSGGTTVTETATGTNRRQVGEDFDFIDADGDVLEVSYFEQDCSHHGREGLFYLTINDEDSVVIPASQIDGLIRYLFTRKKHSERPAE